jgi:hypothetical protein
MGNGAIGDGQYGVMGNGAAMPNKERCSVTRSDGQKKESATGMRLAEQRGQ